MGSLLKYNNITQYRDYQKFKKAPEIGDGTIGVEKMTAQQKLDKAARDRASTVRSEDLKYS